MKLIDILLRFVLRLCFEKICSFHIYAYIIWNEGLHDSIYVLKYLFDYISCSFHIYAYIIWNEGLHDSIYVLKYLFDYISFIL